MKSKRTKVAVIGAGFVGASAAYAIALKGYCNELWLIDINAEKAAGEASDIHHALPWFSDMTIHAGGYAAIQDSDAIVITAGVNRRPGQSRLDLAEQNAVIAKSVAAEIKKYYNGGVVLVVANPVDVLTHKFTEWLELPHGRVFGTGAMLDTARLIGSLSERLAISASSIEAYIVGEHGDSHVPLWSLATVYGIGLEEYCRQTCIAFGPAQKEEVMRENQTSGADIIRRKGATYFGIGGAVAYITDCIINDRLTALPVSVLLTGQRGVRDTCVSLPCIVGAGGVAKILDPAMSEEEARQFRHSAGVIRKTLDSLSP